MMRTRSKVGRWALNIFAGLGLLYLFTPIFFIVAFSFNKPKGNFNIAWQEFTFENWMHPFAEESLTHALRVSLEMFLVLPLTTPEIVLGSSLATLFLGQNFIDFGFTTIVIAHIMFQVSFVALTVRARIRGFDWTLEQAAQDLGASPMRTFMKVTLPLILPGILAASLLAFALSIDDFIITFFNSGNVVTFPLQIYGAARVRIPPQINVLASMILFISVAVLLSGTIAGMRKEAAKTSAAKPKRRSLTKSA